MKKRITDRDTMRDLQGDIVLVAIEKQEFLYTVIHVIEGDSHWLELSDRTRKPKERGDNLPLTQAVFDNLVPVKHEKAKWKLTL